MQIPINQIDSSWTLFLDRDGVINHEKHKDYIHSWDEFVFYDGVHQAIETFSKIFIITIEPIIYLEENNQIKINEIFIQWLTHNYYIFQNPFY